MCRLVIVHMADSVAFVHDMFGCLFPNSAFSTDDVYCAPYFVQPVHEVMVVATYQTVVPRLMVATYQAVVPRLVMATYQTVVPRLMVAIEESYLCRISS